MNKHIWILSILLTSLAPITAAAAPPDLCGERVSTVDGGLYEDANGRDISRWCTPHADPPRWDAPVCCVVGEEADCVPTTPRGACSLGMKFWCEYGEQLGEGVACYEPAPSVCAMGLCLELDDPDATVVFDGAIWLCCQDYGADAECVHAGMTEWGEYPESDCGGFLAMCDWGVTNQDGTVDCYG